MKIVIHRGQNQVGGNIIEVSTDSTRIVLDVGYSKIKCHTDMSRVRRLLSKGGADAVFVSHNHDDHVGLARWVHRSIPIYIGQTAYKVMKASDEYKFRRLFKPYGYLKHGKSIRVGDISVTPYRCDHAAYDSYMLYCEAGGETLLYTGDFRDHGWLSFDKLLRDLPKDVDTLICEGTELRYPRREAMSEAELAQRAAELFAETKGPVFALQMPLNIDRTIGLYNAALKSSRIFVEDAYMAQISEVAGGGIPDPDTHDVYAFMPSVLRYPWYKGLKKKATTELLSEKPFVMCVRPLMGGYVKRLSRRISFEGGILFYTCRKSLQNSWFMKRFLMRCEKLGLQTVCLHTGGHADGAAIQRLIETVSPKQVIPVHTNYPDGIATLVPGIKLVK